MSQDLARAAISRCAEGNNCGIIFFGGEPLLCQDLVWDTIEFCEKEGEGRFHYKITTNGLLLEQDFIVKALRNNLHVALSHDGLKEMHDRFRKTPEGRGTFDMLLPKLELLLSSMPYSPIMMTVNPETVDLFSDSVKWLQSKGAQYLICSLNYAGAWDDISLKRLKRQYLILEDWHFNNYRAERKIYFSPFDKLIASHVFPDKGNSCMLGLRQISVGTDGILYPCVQFVGDSNYAIGSVSVGIDNDRRMRLFELNERDKETCAGCALIRRCHNKCGCLNYQTTGDIGKIPAVLCEHERMIYPIADRLAGRLFKKRSAMFIQRHYNSAFPVISYFEDLGA